MEYKIIKNRIARCIFSLIGAILSISGIIDGYDGTFDMIFYFTYLSNMLVFGVFTAQFILELINIVKKTSYQVPAGIKGLALMMITFTFLTVFFVLSPFSLPSDWLDARIHYLVPFITVFDWILFDAHCRFRIYHPLYWVFAPIVYFGYILIVAICGIKYNGGETFPYFFMDVFEYGWGFVLPMILILAVVFLVLGALVTFLDNIPQIKAKKAEKKKLSA